MPPSAEPPRDGWPLPIPTAFNSPPVAKLRPAELPHEWWLPPRDYSVSLSVLFWPTKEYGIGSQTLTKPAEFDLKLAPGATATVTLEVPGDPLQKRLDDAVKEFEKHHEDKLDPAGSIGPILKNFAGAIEIGVAIAKQEAAATP